MPSWAAAGPNWKSGPTPEGKDFRLTGVDKKIKALVDAYGKFRLLTFNPDAPQDTPRRFYARVRSGRPTHGASWPAICRAPDASAATTKSAD